LNENVGKILKLLTEDLASLDKTVNLLEVHKKVVKSGLIETQPKEKLYQGFGYVILAVHLIKYYIKDDRKISLIPNVMKIEDSLKDSDLRKHSLTYSVHDQNLEAYGTVEELEAEAAILKEKRLQDQAVLTRILSKLLSFHERLNLKSSEACQLALELIKVKNGGPLVTLHALISESLYEGVTDDLSLMELRVSDNLLDLLHKIFDAIVLKAIPTS
jgi:hypothetical protein